VALAAWAIATFGGDPTDPDEQPQIGAAANFGAERAPVLPAQSAPFQSLVPLQERDLGRLVHLTAIVQSRVVDNKVWVQTVGGRRILLRFEPAPPEGALAGVRPGARIDVDGYLQKISRAEFKVWIDTLGVSVPRPPPGRKFGDLPNPEFARIDSLFIKNFYVSVRPEELAKSRAAER
jgi:hypothetical protein